MLEGRASRTAQHNALFRALDARRPRNQRIVGDALAARFLPPKFRLVAGLARVAPVGRAIESFIDRHWPGPRGGVVARTHLIDELVEHALADVRQVVLLGAGFDSRPYRLDAMRDVPIFEVDHPSTQEMKRRVVRRALGGLPPNVAFVGVDFSRATLLDALREAGCPRRLSTLVVWEGVTNYLTANTVATTFDAIASWVAAGSPVVFTYIDRRMLDGTVDFDGASQSSTHVSRVGEPYTFGLHPDELASYLAERGFALDSDVTVPQAARARGWPLHGYAYYHVAVAKKS